MIERIAYTPPQLDILDKLDEEADLLRDDHSRASDEELADLLGEAAEEIQRLRTAMARIEELAAWPEAPWDVEIYDIARSTRG